MKLYRSGWVGKNDTALEENNLNEEPTAGAVAIQIILAMDMCLPRP